MEFKIRFKKLREEKQLTQTEIAEELNKYSHINTKIFPQTVSYWENGREPSYETLIIISSFFNVSIDYLLGVSNIKHIRINNEKEYIESLETQNTILKQTNLKYDNFINKLSYDIKSL